MPRKTRSQPGASGGAYTNRTDLTQPVAVPTGLPYGEHQQLQQAQSQLPIPQVAGTPVAAPPSLAAQQGSQPGQDVALAQAQAHQFQPVGLAAPTQRPAEPVTAGLATGPGPGPEALNQSTTTADTLQRLATSTGNPAIQIMADRAKRFGV